MTQVYDWAADENTMSEEKSFMPPTHNDNSIFHGSGVPFSDWEETREEAVAATTWQDGYHYGYNDAMMTEPTRAVIEQIDHSYIAPESMLDSGHTN